MTAPQPLPIGPDIQAWLEDNPVPPAPGDAWNTWRASASRLGPDAVPALIEALRTASPVVQYGALIALRELGVEAWAEGYEPTLSYRVTVPGSVEQVVVPVQQDGARA